MKTSASMNNYINKKNKCEFNEKKIFKYKFELKGNNIISKAVDINRGTKFTNLKNNEFQKTTNNNNHEEEDDYQNDIYNKNLSNFKFFSDLFDDDVHKYRTISSFNSFQKKYRDINSFALLRKNFSNRRNKRNHSKDIDSIVFHSGLNLTYEKRIKNFLVKKNSKLKVIDKDKKYFMKIVRIFDKNHKMIQRKYNKKIRKKKIIVNGSLSNIKNNHINNNNYINNNKDKYSKRYKKQILKRNKNMVYFHVKASSQPVIEINDRNNNHELSKLVNTERKYYNPQPKEEEIDLYGLNNIKPLAKNLYYKFSPITPNASMKSYETANIEEDDRIKKLKNSNIFIGLNKKKITDNNNNNINKRNINSKDNINNQIKSSNLNNSRAYKKYNNRKSKSKSMFENDYSKENNNIYNGEVNKNKNKSKVFEIDQKQHQEPKIIFRRIGNVRQGEKMEIKDKLDNKKNNNRYIYPNYIITKNKEKNENKNNNYYKINNITNINVGRNNDRENNNLSKLSLYNPVKKDLNISYINKRKHIQVNINDKKDYNNMLNVTSSNIIQRKINDSAKTLKDKSIYNSACSNYNNLMSKKKKNIYNLTKSVNNIQVPNLDITLDNNKTRIIKRDDNQHKSDILINNRSFILNSARTAGREEKATDKIGIKMNNDLSISNKPFNSNKSEINADRYKKIKAIKPEKESTSSFRYFWNRFQIENKSKNNNNNNNNQPNASQNNNNNINNIFLYNKIEQQKKLNNYNHNGSSSQNNLHYYFNRDNNNNKNIDKWKENLINNIQNDSINLNDDKNNRPNYFRRGLRKYNEIKSMSNEKIKNKEENADISEMNNNIRNTIMNSTSMDNIKLIKKKTNDEKENDITINDIQIIKNSNDNDKNMEKKKNRNENKRYVFIRK